MSQQTIEQVLIFAAGRGQRMSPCTDTIAKPLIPLGPSPLCGLSWTLDQLPLKTMKTVVVNCYYLAEQVSNFLKTHYPFVQVSHESLPLETGGGLLHALPYFDTSKPLLLLNSDTIIQGLKEHLPILIEKHFRLSHPHDAISLAVSPLNAHKHQGIGHKGPGDYVIDANQRLTHRSRAINKGKEAYVFVGPRVVGPHYLSAQLLKEHADIVYDNQQDVSFSMIKLFHQAEAFQQLYGHMIDSPWQGLTTVEDIQTAKNLLK